MPPEPNEKIEGILKRYAQKRRVESGPNFELHPATRKMLQGEVMRVFSNSEAETKPSFSFALWPRLAFVGIFTALLAATVLVLNTPKKSAFELSQRSDALSAPATVARDQAEKETSVATFSAGKNELAKMNAPGSASASPPARELKIVARGGAEASTVDRAEKQFSDPAGRIAASKKEIDAISGYAGVPAYKKDEPVRAAKVVADATLTNSAITSPHSSSLGITSTSQLLEDVSAPARRKFVQQDLRAKYRQNLLSPAQPKILQTFEFAHVGNRIQLIDNDGSVYEGEISDAAKDVFSRSNLKSKTEPAPEFAFSVVGTNRQLNRVVAISGKFASANKNLIEDEKPSERTRASFDAGEFKKMAGIAGNGSIQAKVSIGGTNEFEIHAMEVPK